MMPSAQPTEVVATFDPRTNFVWIVDAGVVLCQSAEAHAVLQTELDVRVV